MVLLFYLLPAELQDKVEKLIQKCEQEGEIEAIRLRNQQPLSVRYGGCELVGNRIIQQQDLYDVLEIATNHSLYAYEKEIRQGYLTVRGNRIGICGKGIYEGEKLVGIKEFSSLHIRCANEKKGIAARLMPSLFSEKQLCNTLVISPPGYGKTTLLREIISELSELGYQVGVVDEREEIFRENIGTRVDVLSGIQKDVGMQMLLRSMGPQVIALDEIDLLREKQVLRRAITSGCAVVATMHGKMSRSLWKGFSRYVEVNLEEGRRVYRVYDETSELLQVCP